MADKKVSSVVKAGPVSVTNPAPVVNPSNSSKVSTNTSGANRAYTAHSLNLFHKENYLWMLAGIAIIALGMFLMSGGQSNDPNVFDQKEVYSKTRITIAPLLIIIGLGLEVFAIFKKPKI